MQDIPLIDRDKPLEELPVTLKQPGDYFIYRVKGEKAISIAYYRAFTRDKETGIKTYLHEDEPMTRELCNSFTRSNDATQIGIRKIKDTDYKEVFGGDSYQLETFVQKALKQLVVWDFDLTLTEIHTFHDHLYSLQHKHPMRTSQQTRQVIKALSSLPHVFQIIVSNNSKEIINEIIGEHYWSKDSSFSDYFKGIYDRESFHIEERKDNKAVSMAIFYDDWVAPDLYLDFTEKSPDEMVIDIINISLVDDEEEFKEGKQFCSFLKSLGVEIVEVNGTDTKDISHLEKLNQQFRLNLNLKGEASLVSHPIVPEQQVSRAVKSTASTETSSLLRNSIWNQQRDEEKRCSPCLRCTIL